MVHFPSPNDFSYLGVKSTFKKEIVNVVSSHPDKISCFGMFMCKWLKICFCLKNATNMFPKRYCLVSGTTGTKAMSCIWHGIFSISYDMTLLSNANAFHHGCKLLNCPYKERSQASPPPIVVHDNTNYIQPVRSYSCGWNAKRGAKRQDTILK